MGKEFYEKQKRRNAAATFELELQIQAADDFGFQMTYAGFMGPHKYDYPLVAKAYEDTIGGLGTEGLPRTRVIELAARRLEASVVDAGFRERQTTCRDRFALSSDGTLTGTLSCERLYDDRDQASTVTISFRCPMADVGGAT